MRALGCWPWLVTDVTIGPCGCWVRQSSVELCLTVWQIENNECAGIDHIQREFEFLGGLCNKQEDRPVELRVWKFLNPASEWSMKCLRTMIPDLLQEIAVSGC